MKFYVVGFSKPVYGDALVYANSGSEALTMMRRAGFTPNPGDRYLLGTERQQMRRDYLGEIEDWMKEKAREEGFVILWSEGDNG